MSETNLEPKTRLDKWLWHARQAKTRTLAQKMIASGKVRVNGSKVSAAKKLVGAQDVLTITQPQSIKILKIIACGEKRTSFAIAQNLYEDLSPPKELKHKQEELQTEPIAGKRPDKRDRRKAQILNGKMDLI